MGKLAKGLLAMKTEHLSPERTVCPHCQSSMRADYRNDRTLSLLDAHSESIVFELFAHLLITRTARI